MKFFENIFARKPKSETSTMANQVVSKEKLPLSALEQLTPHTEGDTFRLEMFKAARRIGAEPHVDNQGLGVLAFIIDTDDAQVEALLGAFSRFGYPRGEYKRSDDGGSLGSGEVNWEDYPRNRFLMRTLLKDEHRTSSDEFFIHNLDQKYQ